MLHPKQKVELRAYIAAILEEARNDDRSEMLRRIDFFERWVSDQIDEGMSSILNVQGKIERKDRLS